MEQAFPNVPFENAEQLHQNFMDEYCNDFFERLRSRIPAPATEDDLNFFAKLVDKLSGFGDDKKIEFDQNMNSAFALGMGTPSVCILVSAVEGKNYNVLKAALADPHRLKVDLSYAAKEEVGTLPLITAVSLGDVEAVMILLRANASKVQPTSSGLTAEQALAALCDQKHPNAPKIAALFHGAVIGGKTKASDEEAKEALRCANDPNGADNDKFTILGQLLVMYPHLAGDAIGLPGTDNSYSTLLYSACRANNKRAVEHLLSIGAEPAKPVTGENTPLHVACFRGHVDIVRILMNTGKVKPFDVNSIGETCLTCFSDGLSEDICKEVVSIINLPLAKQQLDYFRQNSANPDKSKLEEFQSTLELIPADSLLDISALGLVSSNNGSTHTTLLSELILYKCESAIDIVLRRGADANGPLHGAERKQEAAAKTAKQQGGDTTGVTGAIASATANVTNVRTGRGRRGQRDAAAGAGAGASDPKSSLSQRFAFTTLTKSFDASALLDDKSKQIAKKIVLPLLLACQLQLISIAKLLVKWGADISLISGKFGAAIDDFIELNVREKSAIDKAYEFVVGKSWAKNRRQWLEDFIKNPHPDTITTECPRAGYISSSPIASTRKSLLVLAVENVNIVAFDLLFATHVFNLSQKDFDHPNHSLLHIAASKQSAYMVKKLLEAGADALCKNTATQTPMDVTPAAAADVKALLQVAIKKIDDDRKASELQNFCQSLPNRFDSAAPSVKIAAGSFPFTEDGALGAIKDALTRAVVDYTKNLQGNGGPIGRAFKTAVSRLVLATNKKKIDDGKLRPFMSLAAPQLFTVSLEAMFKSEVAAALISIVPELVVGFRVGSSHRSEAEQLLKNTAASSSSSSAKDVMEKSLPTVCQQLLEIAVAQWKQIASFDEKLPRFSYTLLCKIVIPRVEAVWKYQELVPTRWNEIQNSSTATRLLEVVGVIDEDISGFLNGEITDEWLAITHLAPIVGSLNVIHNTMMTPAKKLELMESEIHKGLQSAAKDVADQIRIDLSTSGVAPVDEINTATIKHYFEIVAKDQATAWIKIASAAGQLLFTDGNSPVDKNELSSIDFVQKRIICASACFGNLSALRNLLIAARTPGTTDPSQKRFVGQTSALIDIGKNGVASIADLFNKILRPLHLENVWRAMPMYEFAETVEQKINASDVVLVSAGTGSGKSVLMPQFLAARKEGRRVICTQPRRIAVRGIGSRSQELFGKTRAGFQVGGSTNPAPAAALQIKTDALFANDVLAAVGQINNRPSGVAATSARDYNFDNTIVVIDEVHERNAMIDTLILGVCELIRSGKCQNLKLVLASATVSSEFFKMTAESGFGLKFDLATFNVTGPFNIKVEPAVPLWTDPRALKDKDNKFMSDVRPLRAAADAKKLVVDPNGNIRPNVRVLVFLPEISEVEKAYKEFTNVLTQGKVPAVALHGRTEGADGKVKDALVVFANNIAETSITIPGLNHVLDFNLSMKVDVDGTHNARSLDVSAATKSACDQRKGRTGRQCDGIYRHYYDLSKFTDSAVVSYDTLPNESLLQFEMRIRYFFKKTLFKRDQVPPEVAKEYPTLGLGINVRPGLDFSLIPSDAKHLQIAAAVCLTPNLWRCVKYAMDEQTCPLAMIWLSAIVESRETATVSGKLGDHHINVFGKNGDQGILLDIYNGFLLEKAGVEKTGKEFDDAALEAYCLKSVPAAKASAASAASPSGAAVASSGAAAAGPSKSSPLNAAWFKNIFHRVHVISEILKNVASIDMSCWTGYDAWAWNDIEDALIAGYYNNIAAVVRSNIHPAYYQGAYHLLNKNQLSGLNIFNDSVLLELKQTDLPVFCLFSFLERRGTRNLMRYCTSISRESVIRACNKLNLNIEHHVALVKKQYDDLCQFINCPGTAPQYANCDTITDSANYSEWLKARNAGGLGYISAEFIVSGNLIQVAETLEAISRDIFNSTLTNPLDSPAALVDAVRQFGMPPATIEMLKKLKDNGGVLDRLRLATSPTRTKDELVAAIAGTNNLQKGLAITNVLLNKIGVIIKGGIVRDLVVSGLPIFNDFDCDAPSGLYTYENSDEKLEIIRKTLAEYGLKFPANIYDPYLGKNTPCIYGDSFCTKYTPGTRKAMARFLDGQGMEIEIVSPWNDAYIPVQNMDFSCNNLRLIPGVTDKIHQSYPIFMTAMDIIQDLVLKPKRRTACIRYAQWGPAGVGTDGLFHNRKLTADCSTFAGKKMQERIDKFRAKPKDFHFTEACLVSSGEVSLMHGTEAPIAQLILQGGFLPSTNGMLREGVYASRSLWTVEAFAKRHAGENPYAILRFTADLGNLLVLKERDEEWHDKNPKCRTCFLSEQNSWRDIEEWVIYGKTKEDVRPFIKDIEIVKDTTNDSK